MKQFFRDCKKLCHSLYAIDSIHIITKHLPHYSFRDTMKQTKIALLTAALLLTLTTGAEAAKVRAKPSFSRPAPAAVKKAPAPVTNPVPARPAAPAAAPAGRRSSPAGRRSCPWTSISP